MAVKVNLPKAEPQEEKPENMCSGCPGHCCRLRVDLTSYDVFRLVLLENKPASDFAQAIFAEHDDALAFKAEGRMVKLILKHKQNGWCHFFREHKELGCSVEGSKPAICLSYPFSLVDGNSVMRGNALCPPMNRLKADRVKMSPHVLEDGLWEFSRYQEMVDDWNGFANGSETPADFLKFAASEMDLERTAVGRFVRKVKRKFRRLRSGLAGPRGSG